MIIPLKRTLENRLRDLGEIPKNYWATSMPRKYFSLSKSLV